MDAADGEREWLDLVAGVLAAPVTALPEERLAAQLVATFDAVGCAFHARPEGDAPVVRLYPADGFPAAARAQWRRVTVEGPGCHPLLRYYLATGDSAPRQIADLPASLVGPRERRRWAALTRESGMEHQLAIPLPTEAVDTPPTPRWFVVGRADAYPAERMRLAARVQRLIVGLDRQATALARWQDRAFASDVRLTPRELAVLTLVADGLTAAAVARRLVVAERTVHKHLERAYAKLGVSDRVSAVLRAQRAGILPADGVLAAAT
jgi:DNA-binding CsgD family transcriptional regulator